MRPVLLCSAVLALTACSGEPPAVEEAIIETTYALDRSRITVSGVSSGAYMAGQLHVAYSDIFSGAGLIAGGPFGCAQGDLGTALGPCLKGGSIDVDALLGTARSAAEAGSIADLSNLSDDTVWLFHSPTDPVVSPDTTMASVAFYTSVESTVVHVDDVAVIHGYPTLDAGAACDAFASPYINACRYDAAGALLSALGAAESPADEATGGLERLSVPDGPDAEMLDYAYLYVPTDCAAGESCGVHVALHGCVQSAELIDDAFAALTGYNRWADRNKLMILYPQAKSSAVAPLNPNGCWDWWGYTGEDYATRSGAQMSVIVDLIDSLAAGE
ncbi:MAG: PHB depolymerase family esterase [Pseudomonadota bacterium]